MDADRLRRASGICNLIAPVVGLSMVGISVSMAPWFDWNRNALSDLGVGSTARIFNSGLIGAGVVGLIGAPGLVISVFRGRLVRVAGGLFASAWIWLVCIGLFPENVGRIHFIVSVAFFVSLSLSMMAIGLGMLRSEAKGNRLYGVLGLGLGITAAVAWTLPHEGVAIPEAISSVAGSVWIAGLGARLLRAPWSYAQDQPGSS